DVLGTDVVVVEPPGLFFRQEHDPPRPVGKPLEHSPSRPSSGCAPWLSRYIAFAELGEAVVRGSLGDRLRLDRAWAAPGSNRGGLSADSRTGTPLCITRRRVDSARTWPPRPGSGYVRCSCGSRISPGRCFQPNLRLSRCVNPLSCRGFTVPGGFCW